MFLEVSAFLAILTLVVADCGTCENSNAASFVYDDALIKTIIQKMDVLQTMNDNLRLKLETLNIIMDEHFIVSRNEFRRELRELKETITEKADKKQTPQPNESAKNCDYSYANLIDIRSSFDKNSVKGDNSCVTASNGNTHVSAMSTAKTSLPTNCDQALRQSGQERGVHKIQVGSSESNAFYVYCETAPEKDEAVGGPAWTLVQRRRDGSIDFFRNWVEYQHGFGNLEGEFFIGLDKLHALTASRLHELWIHMEDFEGEIRWAKYSSFAIGDVRESYALNILGNYSGNAGDSFSMHAGQKFSTKDMDNDKHATANCAVDYTGAWWYNACHESNLNGQYLRGTYPKDKYAKGIDWFKWHNHYYSLKYVHLAIRPVK